ncbi:MbtH family NRPS accessory protein [Roseobacter sp.]|uniref:MbtH family NRPS accessory protein n=1 Tax=Roseobacter sp. TaxID=1907202 RepID=UPI003299A7BF
MTPTHPTFIVTTNEDGRYAIWPQDRALPWGWHPSGYTGGHADCVRHIETVWTDLNISAFAWEGS